MAGKIHRFPFHLFLAALLCSSMATELRPTSRLQKFQHHTKKLEKTPTQTQHTLDLSRLGSKVVVAGNSTLLSSNQSFELGFFTLDGGSTWYLGIWYFSIPIRTYVWVANRETPIRGNLTPASATLTANGRLTVTDSAGFPVWSTENTEPAIEARLLDAGNFVLFSSDGKIAWQSFDFPADTWLPEMNITRRRPITSWRSPSDPSPGPYSLRLRPPSYGEFELVFNNTVRYWSTGEWTGGGFAGVPEMTVPYIYTFRFGNPFTPDASFVYAETPPSDDGVRPLLTRFTVDSSGQLLQYTWSPQAASWNMFWSRPESGCRVYRRCGNLGICHGGLRPCDCLAGFQPMVQEAWDSGDFSGGCARKNNRLCISDGDGDDFEEVGAFEFDGAVTVSLPGGNRELCEESCRRNCSCFGISFDFVSGFCKIIHGNAFNLRNSTDSPILYVRVSASSDFAKNRKAKWKIAVLVGGICGFLAVLGAGVIVAVLMRRKRRRKRERKEGESENEGIVFTNLKVFSYKELSAATRGFSDKLGHGGFGAVFRGELPDSTPVAVKRLERPGGGDREFRAEVRTIGNIQHVNLVRLHGFCSEDPHRLLVYDYMPNGPLSSYLRRDHRKVLSWEARFQVAVGTARGIAYLHEECRDCIIHCDIKPENILLDGDRTPKVSDFGLAKLIGRDFSRVLTTMRGTWGYVAPEWISGVAITAKADVYSYGMTLLEILGGRRNVEAPPPGGGGGAELGEERWFFPPWAARRIVEGDVAAVVDPVLVGEYDGREAERAGMVAVWCIQDDEGARPTMGSVVKMLEGTVEVTVPPLPQLLQALVSGDSFPQPGIDSGTVSLGSESSAVSDSGRIRVAESTRIHETELDSRLKGKF